MVQVYYTDAHGELRADILGHGNLKNIEDLDVMCAAATTLTNTLAVNVLSMKEAGFLEEEPVVYIGDDGEGKARLMCKPKAEYYALCKAKFTAVVTGYQVLASIYPLYVGFNHE